MITLKSLQSIWVALATDFGVGPKSVSTFLRRSEGEKLRFLTHDLPHLGKDVDRSLSTSQLNVTGRFKLYKDTALPVFLFEIFIRVYTKEGILRVGCEKDLQLLRQLLLMFYKFETPFSPEQEREAYQKFIQTDDNVKTDNWPKELDAVKHHFQTLLPDDPRDIRPHHSSGSTAEGVDNVSKRVRRTFIPSLFKIFGLEYFFNTRNHAKAWSELYTPQFRSVPARVTLVPKDSRGPRIICMEPHELMFIQKGLQVKLYDHIETASPAKGYINFTDQRINRDLARRASYDHGYATIDLKDASDMVSWELIKKLVPLDWLAVLSATRSSWVTLPDRSICLNKYAPMGSALCFPIEAMLFWSICRVVTDEVWVYGDDIIVPNHVVGEVMELLESFGLVVNRDKSLYTGDFRESCGGEYHYGHDISIERVKSLEPVSLVSFCNLITLRYGEETSRKIISIADESVNGTIIRREPLEGIDSPEPLVYYTSYTSGNVLLRRRYNRDYQCYQLRSLKATQRKHGGRIPINGYDALFDWLTMSEKTCSPEAESFWGSLGFPIGSDPSGYRSTREMRDVILALQKLSKLQIKFDWATTKSFVTGGFNPSS